ncbi:MAG: FAD-dependent oxidoreductase, partial [Granulosicoccus sp.]
MMSKNSGRQTPDYDVVVVGGGMVGSMLAAALSQESRLKVAVLERQEPEPFDPGSSQNYDIRVSALRIATHRMFENIEAWQGISSRRACPSTQMLVWDGEEG